MMLRSLLYFAVAGIAFSASFSCSPDVALNPRIVDTIVYLMAGQSNMAGRGTVESIDTPSIAQLFELDGEGHLAPKEEPNRVYQGALAGLDCGRSFGLSLLSHLPPPVRIGLIQCSVSSTSINEWLGDSIRAGLHLYSNLLSRARAGMQVGLLHGVLWMQGETDADFATGPEHYAESLAAFVRSFRRDVGIARLPFFIGLLPSWCRKPYKDGLNAAIRAASRSLPDVYLFSTDECTARQDSIHLDAAGQRLLGQHMADAAWKVF